MKHAVSAAVLLSFAALSLAAPAAEPLSADKREAYIINPDYTPVNKREAYIINPDYAPVNKREAYNSLQ